MNVTTTEQLAELFQVKKNAITRNFQRNRQRYTKGVHFLELEGAGLKEFKDSIGNPDYLKFTSNLYLWTVSGVRLLAKTCRSEEAWELYEKGLNEVNL